MNDNIDYDRLAASISKALSGSGTGGAPSSGAQMNPAELQKFFKQLKDNTSTWGSVTKSLVTGQKKFQDLSYQIDSLDKKIEEIEDSFDDLDDAAKNQAHALKEQLTKQREATATVQRENVARTATVDGLTNFAKSVVSAAASTAGNFAKGLQDGSSAFSLAGGLMEGAIDGAKGGINALGNTVGAVGMAFSAVPGPVGMVARVAAVAGPAIAGLGEAAAAVSKFYVNYMVKEAELTVAAFNKISASGGLFADGMTGMRESAGQAGLTVKQFSEVMAQNSDNLAQSGLGVTEGAKQMGRVGKVMKDTGITDQLLKLGYGFEEQASLTAETIANMRRSAGGKVNDQEVATQTAKYAESLRLIAAITGEDAKKKAEAVRNENQILAFQIELAKKTPAQRAQINLAMAAMNEMDRKNFRDRAILGEVVNKEGAIYEATMDGARAKGEAAIALFNNNNLTAESVAKLNAQYAEQLKQSGLSQKDFAIAAQYGSGQLSGVAKAQLDTINQSNTYTKEAVDTGKDLVNQQQAATDDLTTGTIEAAKAAQQLALDIQDMVLPQLSQFSQVTAEILKTMSKYVTEFKDVTNKQDEANWKVMTFWEKIESGFARVVEWVGSILDKLTLGGFGGFLKGIFGKDIEDIKQERVKKETEYLEKHGRKVGPAAEEKSKAAQTPFVGKSNEYYAKMQASITEAAKKAGVANPEVIGKLGASQTSLETGYGKHMAGNNAFGIKADASWTGPITEVMTKEFVKGVGMVNVMQKFRAYDKVEDSAKDYVAFLQKNGRYKGVLSATNINDAIKAQAATGYATDPDYGSKLASITNTYGDQGDRGGAATGAFVKATPGGTSMKLAEGGRDELVTPLINGRLPGMDELIDAVKRLVQVSEAQHSTSEKILYATA
jgi:flagellar protein FlgJ